MLDWSDLQHFLAVARGGTLAAAAASLRINPTTVGRRLAALEDGVGTRLFDRTPEGYVLSAAGRDLLVRAERMEAEALSVERELAGADQRLAGTVRLTATEMLATRFIMPEVHRLHAAHPDITLDLVCSNRSVSLARREADIALRLARPVEENIVTRRLAAIDLSLYAARAYVDQHGGASPDGTLDGHRVLAFADARAFAIENRWLDERLGSGRVLMRSDSVSSIYAAVVAGLGVALLPRAVADRDGALVALSQEGPEPRVIWQAVHADVAKSGRVRAVLAFLGDILH